MESFKVADASEYLAITGWVIDVKLAKKAWVWWMKMFLFTLLFGSLSLTAQGKVLDFLSLNLLEQKYIRVTQVLMKTKLSV